MTTVIAFASVFWSSMTSSAAAPREGSGNVGQQVKGNLEGQRWLVMVGAAAVQRDHETQVGTAPREPARLCGRRREQEQLCQLVTGIRSGRSGALVLRGEA